jgi:hypothetical protein
MAKGRNLILSGMSGSIGDITVTPGEGGEVILKEKIHTNPSRTVAQVAQRSRFMTAGQYAKAMKADADYIAIAEKLKSSGRKWVGPYQVAQQDWLNGTELLTAVEDGSVAGAARLLFTGHTISSVEVSVLTFASSYVEDQDQAVINSFDATTCAAYLTDNGDGTYTFDWEAFKTNEGPTEAHLLLKVSVTNKAARTFDFDPVADHAQGDDEWLTTFGDALSFLANK